MSRLPDHLQLRASDRCLQDAGSGLCVEHLDGTPLTPEEMLTIGRRRLLRDVFECESLPGLTEEEAARERENVPSSSLQLAQKLFAQVMRGVHW